MPFMEPLLCGVTKGKLLLPVYFPPCWCFQLAQFSSAQGLFGRNRSSARGRPGSGSPGFADSSDLSRELCSRL